MDYQKGDKFTVQFECEKQDTRYPKHIRVTVVNGGANVVWLRKEDVREESITNYIPAPMLPVVEPAPGQTWRFKTSPKWTMKIIFIDGKSVLYEYLTHNYIGQRSHSRIEAFKREYEYVEG